MKKNIPFRLSLVTIVLLSFNVIAEFDNDILGRGSSSMKSFDSAPYINPLILLDFAGLIGDGADDILLSSIDLPNALISDRYYADEAKIVTINDEDWVYASNDIDWVRYRLYDENNNVFVIQVVSGPVDGKLSFRDNLLMTFSIDKKVVWDQDISRMRHEERLLLNCMGKLPFDFFDGKLSLDEIFEESDGDKSQLGCVMENGNYLTKLAAQYPDLVKKWGSLILNQDDSIEMNSGDSIDEK